MSKLRFSINHHGDAVRIEIAGSFAGVDVETVYHAWQREAWNDALKPVIVDITMITEADKHGRALLLTMYRFGAEIVAESRESSAIAHPIVAVESAVSKRGWIDKLIAFFWNGRHTDFTFPPRAEIISRLSA